MFIFSNKLKSFRDPTGVNDPCRNGRASCTERGSTETTKLHKQAKYESCVKLKSLWYVVMSSI